MIKQLLKGAVTYVPGAYGLLSRKRTGGTNSARYCYSVWLRHLVMADMAGVSTSPSIIAELGPGDSIGTGLAALVSGADQFYAFDIVRYAGVETNLQTLEELVELFRAPIPDKNEFPLVEPHLDSYDFPSRILTDERMDLALDSGRLELIRKSIRASETSDSMVTYKVPWYDSEVVDESTVDMVISQAVLEHVDDLERTYEQMFRWIKPGGFMSHSIDFKSHGSANQWNGHWAYSDVTWRIISGKRPYTINREPHSRHLELITEAGFRVVFDVKNELPSEFELNDLAPRYQSLDPADLTVTSVFVLASL